MVKTNKNNEPVSFLRYLLILTTKQLVDLFNKPEYKQTVLNIIGNYFEKTKKENVNLISREIHSNYIQITFSATPTLDLAKTISNLKSVSSRHFLKQYPEIRSELGGCWNKSYFLASREHMIEERIKDFLNSQ